MILTAYKEKSKAIRIKKKNAEKIKKKLFKNKLIRFDLKIFHDDEYVYFPIQNSLKLNTKYQITYKEFIKNVKKEYSYKDTIQIPDLIKKDLPSSYDIIGDILLIKLKEKVYGYKHEIGEALLISNKSIKTVCVTKSISGEFRTRDIEVVAGDINTNTVHTEFGLKFLVDVSKVYFNPRLANERKRITDFVKNDEIVIDMFSGISPFSIMIAKFANPKMILAVDKNKYAYEFAQKNIRLNNVLHIVDFINGDIKNIYNDLILRDIYADRIIMNLPFSAIDYFNLALKISKNPCNIHYYDILEEENFNIRIDELYKLSKKENVKLTILNINKIKSYSPRQFYICIDIKVEKNADVA